MKSPGLRWERPKMTLSHNLSPTILRASPVTVGLICEWNKSRKSTIRPLIVKTTPITAIIKDLNKHTLISNLTILMPPIETL